MKEEKKGAQIASDPLVEAVRDASGDEEEGGGGGDDEEEDGGGGDEEEDGGGGDDEDGGGGDDDEDGGGVRRSFPPPADRGLYTRVDLAADDISLRCVRVSIPASECIDAFRSILMSGRGRAGAR